MSGKKEKYITAPEMDFITPPEPEAKEAGKGAASFEIQPPRQELYTVHKQFIFQAETQKAWKDAVKKAGISENKYINWLVKKHLAELGYTNVR